VISAGVIGWPVAHSKSPLIHRFWLAKLGIDGDYGRFAVAPDDLGEAIRALPKLGMRGVNVTVPHKVAVMSYLDGVDPLAIKVGAVNTVVVEHDLLIGYNSDVEGFREPLLPVLAERKLPPNHVDDLYDLIGTGGAARAVAVALSGYEVTILGRDEAKAAALADELGLGARYGLGLGARYGFIGSIAALDAPTQEFDPAYPDVKLNLGADQRYSYILINATTLGMTGQPALAINLDNFPDDTIVYDLVYAPLVTPLLAAAHARGMRTIDGLAMLIGQAAAAFERFFGHPAPREHDAELRVLLTA